MLAAALWFGFFATQALMVRAILDRSWPLMWAAALGSFVFSILSMFSIGAYVFLLTCLQLAAMFAMRWRLALAAAVTSILTGALVWILVVPAQIDGFTWIGGFGVYQIIGLAGLLVALRPVTRIRRLLAPAAGGGTAQESQERGQITWK